MEHQTFLNYAVYFGQVPHPLLVSSHWLGHLSSIANLAVHPCFTHSSRKNIRQGSCSIYLMNCNVYNLNNKTGEMECKIKNTQFIVLTLLHNRNINTTTKEARPIRQILKVTILLPTSSALLEAIKSKKIKSTRIGYKFLVARCSVTQLSLINTRAQQKYIVQSFKTVPNQSFFSLKPWVNLRTPNTGV